MRATRIGSVLLLSLDGPDGYPRLERGLLARIGEEIRRANADSGFSGIVITGTERAFAVGAEIDQVARLGPLEAREFALLGQGVMRQIERSPKPVIAAIRGYCFGGGLDLALACHARIASEDARFAHPGAALGILTGWGGTQRLPRTLLPGARAVAMEMLATGRRVTAREAFDCGLITGIEAAGEIISRAVALTSAAHGIT